MKKIFICALAALAMTATSCSDEDNFLADNIQEEGMRTVVLSASLGNRNARSTFELDTDNMTAAFKWATDDAITVFSSSSNTNCTFTLASGQGEASGTFSGSIPNSEDIGTLAYYPYNAGHSTTAFALPPQYGTLKTGSTTDYEAYVENTNAAFVATIENKNAVFQNIAGTLCVKFDKVPTGVDKFVLTADKQISGTFTIETEGSYKVIKNPVTADANAKTVTHHFEALAAEGAMTFYVPLPAGTYSSLKAELKAGDDLVFTKTYTKSQTITRGKLVMMNDLASADYTVTKGADDKITYTVYTAAGLQTVMKLEDIGSINITLAADIDLTDAEKDESGSNLTPIAEYSGTFDGAEHSIKGLTVVRETLPEINQDVHYLGGITDLLNEGKIKNLTLTDCIIEMPKEGSQNVGAIVGRNTNGEINNCHINGNSTISGMNYIGAIVGYFKRENNTTATISGCSVTGAVSITVVGGCVGGIAGAITDDAILTDCHVNNGVKITGGNQIGGIIGSASASTVSGCIVENNVTITGTSAFGNDTGYGTGGIVGQNLKSAVVKNCKFINSTINSKANRVGGIAGMNGGYVMGCIAQNSSVTGGREVGGIVGQLDGFLVIASYANAIKLTQEIKDGEKSYTTGGIVGWHYGANAKKDDAIIGCYAYNCKYEGGAFPTDHKSMNVVGYYDFATNQSKATWDGIFTANYYNASGDQATPVTVDNKGVASSGTAVDWNDAVTAMNTAIGTWNAENDNACTYRWAEKVNGTATTYSTAALEAFVP